MTNVKKIRLTEVFVNVFLESVGESNLTDRKDFLSLIGLEGALRGDHTTGVFDPESVLGDSFC